MIYFVQYRDDGPIKIGQTINLEERLKSYRQLYGDGVRVLGVMPGGRKEEKEILQAFDHLRTNPSVVCEWRDPGPELLKFIAEMAAQWNGENDLPRAKKTLIHAYTADERAAVPNKAWLAELAKFTYASPSMVIDQALMLYAKSVGFGKHKPTRYVVKRRA